MTKLPLVAIAAAAFSIACEVEDPCGEPSYGGKASDESYRTMADARDNAVVDGDSSPVITTPASDAVIDASAGPPTISWASTLSAALGPFPLPEPARRPRASTLIDMLSHAVIPLAHAHLPPVTGDSYLVEIAVPGRECPVAGHTTDLEWQLDDEAFTALKEGSGEPLTLTIVSAYLTENRVSEGPFTSPAPTTFRLE